MEQVGVQVFLVKPFNKRVHRRFGPKVHLVCLQGENINTYFPRDTSITYFFGYKRPDVFHWKAAWQIQRLLGRDAWIVRISSVSKR